MDHSTAIPMQQVPRQRTTYRPGDDDVETHDTRQQVEPILRLPANLFEANENAIILDNPLDDLTPDEVDTVARDFARNHGLSSEEDTFVKAARVLKDPESFPRMRALSEGDKEALRTEQKSFWSQPKQLRVTIIMLAIAAVVQGWTQTSSNGANLNWPQQLGLSGVVDTCQISDTHSSWIFAIVNAATYLSAGVVGCWLTDPLGEFIFGRRAVILVSALIIFASAIGGACTRTWPQLLATRIVLGLGMGMKASVVPVFAAEVAPAHIRGSLVMAWQVFDGLGIMLGFTANLAVSGVGADAWRWQIASCVLPTMILIALVYVCPESPRFLLKRGYYREAYESLILLRYHPILAAKEMFYIHCQIEVEDRLLKRRKSPDVETAPQQASNVTRLEEEAATLPAKRTLGLWAASRYARPVNYWRKLAQLFTIPRNRRALVAALVVMASQQLCGVNFLAFYSSTFFCDANQEDGGNPNSSPSDGYFKSLFLSWGIGLSYFVFAFPAYWLIDRKGRRWLLLVTIPAMAISMLAAALSFKISSADIRGAVVGLFTYIFTLFYSPGMGPVPFTLSAEVFPLESRVVGMSFAVSCNLFGAGLLTLFVPPVSAKIGPPGVLGIFAALNVLAFFLVFFLVPETASAAIGGKEVGSMVSVSLEELNFIFAVPTRRHIQYQAHNVRWAWRHYVLRDPEYARRPEKLYNWASARNKTQEEDEPPRNQE